jgi:predicted MFS family arabinose efflux permease
LAGAGAGPIPLRRNRDFVLLQAGQLFSTAGTQATQIAYPLLVLALTHSPARAGIVGLASVVPYALFGLLAGVAVDRWNRRTLMLTADGVRIVAIGSLVVALVLGRPSFVQIAIVAFVEGTGFVLFNIAEVGALRSVVFPAQLPDAAAVEQGRMSAVTLVGPPIGGALFGLGRVWPFVADLCSYVFSIGSLLAIRTPFQETREGDATPMRGQIAEGFRWLWQQPFLRTCALIFAGTNFTFEGIFLAFVVVARRHGLTSGAIGACIAAFGACSLLGSLIAPVVNRLLSMRAIVVLNLWLNVAIVAFVLVPNVYVLLGAVIPLAFFIPAANSAVIGYRTAVTPDRLVGRVSSVARNIALLAQPLGPLAAGFLLGAFSAQATVLVFTIVCAVLALWATLSPSIRSAPSLSELATA